MEADVVARASWLGQDGTPAARSSRTEGRQFDMTDEDRHETTLRDLRIFLTICETGNLSRAGQRLDIAQSSLSRTIRNLEDGFHLRLLERNGRGVELTDVGIALRDHAERVLAAVDELDQRMADLSEETRGSVSVLLPLHVSRAVAPAFVRAFGASHPGAGIDVLEDNSNARIAQRITAGDVDFGVFFDTSDRSHRNGEEIASEEAYVVGLPGTVGASDIDPIDFDELSGMPLILPRRRTPYREFLEEFAARRHVRLDVVRELEMGSTLLAFVLEREGSTILPLGHFHEMREEGHLAARRIENPRVARRMILKRSTARPRRIVANAVDTFRECIASAGPRWQEAEDF